MTIRKNTALVLFLLIFGLHTAQAAKVETEFPKQYTDEKITMSLQGTGVKKVFMIRAFQAAFYLGEGVPVQEALGDYPKRLDVEYYIRIPGSALNQYTINNMKRNIKLEEFKKLSREIKLMGQYFVDLRLGDRYALTYVPSAGTKFAYNGKIVGTIEGADFAKALFAVWIGPKPFDPGLKDKILGRPKTGSRWFGVP